MPHNGYVRSLSLSKIIRWPVKVTLFCKNAPTIWDQHRLKWALKPSIFTPKAWTSKNPLGPHLPDSSPTLKTFCTQTLFMNFTIPMISHLFSKMFNKLCYNLTLQVPNLEVCIFPLFSPVLTLPTVTHGWIYLWCLSYIIYPRYLLWPFLYMSKLP